MLHRNRTEKLAKPVLDLYNEMEMEMLTNIARRIRLNKVHLEDIELLMDNEMLWLMSMMQDLGILNRDNLRVIRDMAGLTSREMNRVLLNAGLEGLEENEKRLEKAYQKGAHLIKPPPIEGSPIMMGILLAYQNQANNILNLTNQTMLSQARVIYRDILNSVAADVLVSNLTIQEATRKAISKWAEQGIPALIDRAGRRWGVEGYVRMVMMSTQRSVVTEMQFQRFEEWGSDLIEVSSHAGNRPGCEPYAGRIFSLKEGHPKYPYLYDPNIGRIGDADSLFGINCGHVSYAFIEGISEQRHFPNDPEENKRVYQESQQQRAIERSIRKAKTRERMLREIGDMEGATKARQLVRNRQAKMREFINDTGRTRRYDREQIVK